MRLAAALGILAIGLGCSSAEPGSPTGSITTALEGTRYFFFPSALVIPEPDQVTIRFAADEGRPIWIETESGIEERTFGDAELISLLVIGDAGAPSLPAELSGGTSDADYAPAIQVKFLGASTVYEGLLDGKPGLFVESEGELVVLDGDGLPFTEEEMGKATGIGVGGERGSWGPHFPK